LSILKCIVSKVPRYLHKGGGVSSVPVRFLYMSRYSSCGKSGIYGFTEQIAESDHLLARILTLKTDSHARIHYNRWSTSWLHYDGYLSEVLSNKSYVVEISICCLCEIREFIVPT
jgi:hypothetical protein